MVEPASPLDTLLAAPLPGGALRLAAEPVTARVSLRLRDAAAIDRAGEALGLALPLVANRFAASGGTSALWLGPDEWLVTSTQTDGTSLAARLAEAIGDAPASVVDVTHRSVTLRVSGVGAADALAGGCPLDLDARVFPTGAATRTVLAKTEILLQRVEPDAFLVDVWRSFAPYAVGLLREEARSLAAG